MKQVPPLAVTLTGVTSVLAVGTIFPLAGLATLGPALTSPVFPPISLTVPLTPLKSQAWALFIIIQLGPMLPTQTFRLHSVPDRVVLLTIQVAYFGPRARKNLVAVRVSAQKPLVGILRFTCFSPTSSLRGACLVSPARNINPPLPLTT